MLRSMYSGISGMKANQTKMDVVGNNVANVGNTAYKKTGTRFSDALYQTAIYASAPGGGLGGVNPGQVGIGTKVSGIFKNMVQGAIQPTGRPTDLALDGDGFFSVKITDNQTAYTRDGSFSLDKDGYLVTSQGYKVLGMESINNNGTITEVGIKEIQVPKEIYFVKVTTKTPDPSDATKFLQKEVPIDKVVYETALKNGTTITVGAGTVGTENTVSIEGVEYKYNTFTVDPKVANSVTPKKVLTFNISKTGDVSYLLNDGTKYPQMDTGGNLAKGASQQKLKIGVFMNPEGLESIGGNLYGVSANSGEPINTKVYGQINQGAIEMSNVDLSEEFTEMIVTTRAFQAASKMITTSDELLQEIINLKR